MQFLEKILLNGFIFFFFLMAESDPCSLLTFQQFRKVERRKSGSCRDRRGESHGDVPMTSVRLLNYPSSQEQTLGLICTLLFTP